MTIDEINCLIYNQTHGLIDRVIEEIEPEDIMLVINALYFSARWARSFNPMGEIEGLFNLENGEQVEATFLSTTHIPLAVSVTDSHEAVLLPYDDDRFGFFLVRPTDGTNIRDFVESNNVVEIMAFRCPSWGFGSYAKDSVVSWIYCL